MIIYMSNQLARLITHRILFTASIIFKQMKNYDVLDLRETQLDVLIQVNLLFI